METRDEDQSMTNRPDTLYREPEPIPDISLALLGSSVFRHFWNPERLPERWWWTALDLLPLGLAAGLAVLCRSADGDIPATTRILQATLVLPLLPPILLGLRVRRRIDVWFAPAQAEHAVLAFADERRFLDAVLGGPRARFHFGCAVCLGFLILDPERPLLPPASMGPGFLNAIQLRVLAFAFVVGEFHVWSSARAKLEDGAPFSPMTIIIPIGLVLGKYWTDKLNLVANYPIHGIDPILSIYWGLPLPTLMMAVWAVRHRSRVRMKLAGASREESLSQRLSSQLNAAREDREIREDGEPPPSDRTP